MKTKFKTKIVGADDPVRPACKEYQKKNAGITLIALIVTIIILIILAGITIALISGGNGIMSKATAAVDKNNIETAKEQVTLKIGEYQSDFYEGRYVTLEIGNEVKQGDWIYEQCEKEKDKDNAISTKDYKFTITPDGENPYIVTILKNKKLPGEVKGTLSIDGKLEWEEVIIADSGSEEKDPTKTDAGDVLKTLPPEWGTETIYKVKTANGEVVKVKQEASVYAVSDGNGEVVPVPNGFWYVGGTVDSGVVISDDKNDQNKYKGQEDVPAGVIYNSDGTVKTEGELTEDEKKTVILGNQFVWIPCTAENYKKENFGKSNTAWDTLTNNVEKKSAIKYGGFYVGRYEAGTSEITLSSGASFDKTSTASNWQNGNFVSSYATGKITSKAGEIPYYYADYTTAVEMSEKMYNTSSAQSGLITGTMWDVMMKFITEDNETYSDLKSTLWGNYNTDTGLIYTAGQGRYLTYNSSNGSTSNAIVADEKYHYGIRTTASTEDVKRKNMYDLAGNLSEWTEESASTGYEYLSANYMLRGGCFDIAYYERPVCHRDYLNATCNRVFTGFRPVLYIK